MAELTEVLIFADGVLFPTNCSNVHKSANNQSRGRPDITEKQRVQSMRLCRLATTTWPGMSCFGIY